jgi:Fe-S-cluster containining protein
MLTHMTERELLQKLKEFECQRCNLCCRQPGFVYVTLEEAEEIAHFLDIDIYDFANRYCDLFDRRKLVLKKYEDESCVFLKENGCSIYSARPQQCRDFPVKWMTIRSFDYCEGLKALN